MVAAFECFHSAWHIDYMPLPMRTVIVRSARAMALVSAVESVMYKVDQSTGNVLLGSIDAVEQVLEAGGAYLQELPGSRPWPCHS